jgi:H+/Na+-translocating ferredoxin:NAD+ oxidoreductase subunit E
MSAWKEFMKGIWEQNPVFRLVLGMCPVLAVTTSAIDAIGMGLSATFVLTMSNLSVSLLRKGIPPRVRLPAFIVIIATFVTIVDMVLKAYMFDLHKSLGLFIPLIVVNCVILGRAEAFASKNKPIFSIIDGLGMGLGFTLALFILGSIREVLGNGTIFGASILAEGMDPILLFILPPGAFVSLGFLIAGMNAIEERRKTNG